MRARRVGSGSISNPEGDDVGGTVTDMGSLDGDGAYVPTDPGKTVGGPADPQGNDLHVSSRTCPRCQHVIADETPVRKLVSGEYAHDVCPPSPSGRA